MTTDNLSPLQAIEAKESEIRRRLELVQQQADADIQAAHQAAERLIEEHDTQGQNEAQARYEQGLNQAHQEAEAIVEAAQTRAQTMRQQAQARLDDVMRRVLKLVLTTASDTDDASSEWLETQEFAIPQ